MASWPTSIPTDATLYVAVNELQTNLSSGITNSQTTITLNSTTSFPTVGLVLIDNEIIKYTGISGSDLTSCTRAFDGTSAATHSAGAVVSFAICAAHHNVSKDEIIALATYLSNNLGTGAQPLSNGSRALASNGSGKIIESSVTSTELGYLSGVTSAIQTQLGLLAPKASPTFTGTVTTPLTANKAVATGASGVLAASTTTNTELGYVAGVTSAIQTQLDGKASTSGTFLTTTDQTASGVKTFSGQLIGKGTATNDSASTGYIGEYVSSANAAGANAPTSTNWGDATSISLTAGDWDVTGVVYWGRAGGTWTSASTGVSVTTGNSATGLSLGDNYLSNTFTAASVTEGFGHTIANYRYSLASTTTVYLKVNSTYTIGPTAYYYRLSARRVR